MDEQLRRLERAWRDGSVEAGAALLAARERRGELSRDRLELAAFMGDGPARLALGLPLEAKGDDRLPSGLFVPGAPIHLAPAARDPVVDVRTFDADLGVRATITRGIGHEPWLRAASAELEAIGATRLVLDVDGLSHVSSGGLSTLLRDATRLGDAGGGVALVRVRPRLQVLLDMLGITPFFVLAGSEEQAIAALPRRAAGAVSAAAWRRRVARWPHLDAPRCEGHDDVAARAAIAAWALGYLTA